MAAGQTVVEYNGVTLRNCLTKRFEEEAVYDPSGTDILYHKFTVRVVGFVHGITDQTTLVTMPNPGGFSSAQHHVHVRADLLEPRGEFTMRLGADSSGSGGRILLQARPATRVAVNNPSNFDMDNGPKPKVLSVVNIAGDHLIKIEFEIEICVLQCDRNGNADSNPSGVLSNRWSVSDRIDSNFYTTRTFTGRLRTVTAIANPNRFRHFVVPPLQTGMQRDSMTFVVDATGLNLDYTIVDKEVAWSAPAPATNWSVTYTESFGEHGITQFGEIDIMLGGDRYADKKVMMCIGASIIENLLLPQGGVVGGVGGKIVHRLLSYSVTDISSNRQENQIRMYARVEHHHTSPAIGVLVAAGKLGRPIDENVIPGYNNDLSRGGRDGESIEMHGPIPLVASFHAYLQSSCDPDHEISTADESEDAGSGSGRRLGGLTVRVVDSLPDEPADYLSESHLTNIYTFWRMESKYVIDGVSVQLPIAASAVTSTSSLSDPTSIVVKLGRGVAKRVVRLHGERLGAWPELPTATDYTDSNGIKATLLKKNILPDTPRRSADGTQIFTVHADYEFALSRPPTDTEQLAVGQNPWEDTGLYFTENDTQSGKRIG